MKATTFEILVVESCNGDNVILNQHAVVTEDTKKEQLKFT
jgi:hypothetical protein